ncbi:uncharacterized protein LOC131603429 isoform X2 [Vicia villosa]|uniref:uncharacterized protein LOC131603429 isoform X2 n=1 Tax=Vicia villosa TaxID=3911 RepID=UPI00273CB1E2|nr:uncharacterized protein LOC131603429 isoform X2 [Vicia villosa]
MGPKSKTKKTDLLQTLGDFTSKDNWDNFFTIRPDSFEWYAEWPHLRDPLISLLQTLTPLPSSLPILVPACGNSRLSEHLYDAGYTSITNVDFSKVVISNMLRSNIRARPLMRWRVMDITAMQFEDESFGAVIDKGGLDALMEPELGPSLGNQYLSEVKRVLKPGGKFVCLTLAEPHVLDILFSKFRLGWKMSVDAIPLDPSSKLQTFMVVVEKELSTTVHQITSLLHNTSLHCNSKQALGLREFLQNENQVREKLSSSSDKLYSMEDVQEDLTKISQGRRLQLTLGGQGCSVFSYRAVVLDAEEQSDPFTYHCGVFIVPKIRAPEWLFFSEEGQWMVVRSSKAARLIMVFLDTSHTNATMDEIKKDLSPLVKQLEPNENDSGAQIPFLMASDGIKKRNIVHQTTSPLTGSIIVEDVVYENVDSEVSCIFPSQELMFRRLVFERAANLVQSETLLIDEHSTKLVGETVKRKANSSSKSKKDNQLTVYHGYVASSYHSGIISGFTLISSYMENVASSGKTVKAVIIGLGAGLLPMFLHSCIPVLEIEAVELDPVVAHIAREYFSFVEDKRLKVHIADGIQFIRESTSSGANGSSTTSHAEGVEDTKVDIIIVDADSSDPSSGLACPAPDFLEESFLETVKEKLSEEGLFVVNLVSRSQAIKETALLKMKKVFSHVFCLQFDEDVNEIHFALKSESCIEDNSFSEASLKLEKLLKFNHPEIGQKIINATKNIRRLK